MKAPTRDDWLKALTDTGLHYESADDAVTVIEFAKLMALKQSTAYGQLEALVSAGKAVKVRKFSKTNTYGRMVFHVAYRLTGTTAAAAKAGNRRRT